MENNNIQIFNSKRPVYNRYELKINRDESLIQIAIKGEEITEYDIPFSTIAEVEMSTYGFLTQEQIREKERIEYSEAIQTLAGYKKQKVSTNKGSMLGRAIVGGLIAGPVGAIVGGATASKTIEDTSYASNNKKVFPEHTGYALSIRLNDIDVPYIKYDCGEDSEGANTIYSILKILIRQNSNNGFAESEKVEVRKKEKAKPIIQREKGISEQGAKEDIRKQYSSSVNNVKPVSNKLMVLYAICQAIFLGLLLTVWNAGWWPAIILFISCFIQIFPLGGIFDYEERGFSFFSKGIIFSSLIFIMFESLLPYFATASINLYLRNIDMNLYLRSYEGGFITFLLSPLLASLLSVGIGYTFKSIFPKKRKKQENFSLPALVASIINFLLIGGASLVLKMDNETFLPCTIIAFIYAIISSIFVYYMTVEYSVDKKEKYNYKDFALGALFQFCLMVIIIILCAKFGIIDGYSYPLSAEDVW